MKEKIKICAKECGISDIGFCAAEKMPELLESFSADTPFINVTPKMRINPFGIMEDAKSIIVMLFSYKTDSKGNISKYAHGKDYHLVLEKKTEPLISLLTENGYKAEFFCDNASLDERYLAKKAGLGFIGENGFLISPTLGSFVFIAHILTDCEIMPDKEITSACAGCGKCKRECPTGALKTGDFYSCLSYITQKKGELSEAEQKLIFDTKMCWGCDICQECCPHNEGVGNTDIPEFSENLITDLYESDISNREFKRLYSDRAFSWRGKSVTDRNLNILKSFHR